MSRINDLSLKVANPADTKPSKLGTPYIEVTPAPAAEGEEVAAAAVQPKPRRLANLVTSWGPGVSKLKKLASGQHQVQITGGGW